MENKRKRMIIQRLMMSGVFFAIFLFKEMQAAASGIVQPLNGVVGVFDNPNFWMIATAYAIFNAAVSAMPLPDTAPVLSNLFYRWAYTFLHTLSMNFQQAFSTKRLVPVDEPMKK